MTAGSVRHVKRFIPVPRVAVYTFDSEGNLVNFQPLAPYLAAELNLQPYDSLDGLLNVLRNLFPGELSVLHPSGETGKEDGNGRAATIDSLLLGNNSPVNGVFTEANTGAQRNQGIHSPSVFGAFSERYERIRVVRQGGGGGVDGESGVYRIERPVMQRISVVHSSPFQFRDPSEAEIHALYSEEYTRTSGEIVKSVVAQVKGIDGLAALVHDLRGTLRYKGFYLNAADFNGLQRLAMAAYTRGLKYFGTVTSGTISEGTNFMKWARAASPDNYYPYRLFAICDSLTTAQMMEYDQVLVRGETAARILQSLEGLSPESFPCLAKAFREWKVSDTINSVILDIPPGEKQETVEAVLADAERFRDYFRQEHGEEVSVLSKSASTPFGASTRLYLRPVLLADGSPLTKLGSFGFYMGTQGIPDAKRRLVYFADNYGSGEEIPLGREALIGVEIVNGAGIGAEFGKHGVPAVITAPSYLIAADIVSRIIEEAVPAQLPGWMLPRFLPTLQKPLYT
ncbi:hypothetical protein HYU15_00075 [Candidatus Woesearchaeota archaeon]|nr:hypothetical protein [Candidatus Woesearchaeota archaeon]